MAKETKNQLTEVNPSDVSQTALKVFFNITNAWDLTESEKKTLLGNPSSSQYECWRAGTESALSEDILMRISYVIGIYKNLRLLFPTESRANAWIRKPNREFGGEPALSKMYEDLASVRRYLDSFVE